MGIDYDSRSSYGWYVDDEESWKSFLTLLPEDSRYKNVGFGESLYNEKDEVEEEWYEIIENVCEEIGFPYETSGNYYCDDADSVIILLGISVEGKTLEEIKEAADKYKDKYEKLEKAFGKPPYICVDFCVY